MHVAHNKTQTQTHEAHMSIYINLEAHMSFITCMKLTWACDVKKQTLKHKHTVYNIKIRRTNGAKQVLKSSKPKQSIKHINEQIQLEIHKAQWSAIQHIVQTSSNEHIYIYSCFLWVWGFYIWTLLVARLSIYWIAHLSLCTNANKKKMERETQRWQHINGAPNM